MSIRPTANAVVPRRRQQRIQQHRLQMCAATGLARYRDRHQARAGAEALMAGSTRDQVTAWKCPDCDGWHLERLAVREPIAVGHAGVATEAFRSSLVTRRRRFFIVDIECLTFGAKATPQQVAKLWDVLRREAPGVSPRDRVLIGAARKVARRYRPAIQGPNCSWVTAADVKDGADQALLSAFDLWRTARDFDELVICSGDGNAFTDVAIQAKRAGLAVHVVTTQAPAGERSILSRKLAAAADLHTVIRLQARASCHTDHTSLATAA